MMKNFRVGLTELLKTYDHPRPFVCDGNPMHCEVFIVGINAATEMEKDFWTFWSDDIGFNKKDWLETYILERSLKPLKEGKIRRNKISNTRQRIEWLVETINPIKTLETNLFVRPTATAKELYPQDKEIKVFEYLIQTIKPKILFTHGKEVKDRLEGLYKIIHINEEVYEVELFGKKTKVISMNHLSRGWSKTKTEDVGEVIKGKIISTLQ